MHQPTGTQAYRNSANKQEKDMAIEFFSDLFGLKYLKNYIGGITFLARFPSMMQTSSTGSYYVRLKTDTGALEDGLRVPPRSRRFAAAELDPRLEVVLPLLHERLSGLNTESPFPRTYSFLGIEIQSTLQTLGAVLLKHILITFHNVYLEHKSSCKATYLTSSMKYDRQFNAASMVRRIEALQVKLNAAKDKEERRALEDDVTGKAGAVSSYYLSMLRIVCSSIDPVVLLVWDLCRGRRTITKGCGLHSEGRG
ncbi:hypothetical protein EDD16DRAFT_1224990 [Pisolithus croceorrhizus]|nr:hypothetical protein EDD16DRAFT_1224990 [Pisolithus croceorrhizus]